MKSKRIELLSPAGDFERLKITLLYGADAVYFGGQEFGLRANANNFSVEEIKEACTFAHSLGKKVYLTVNIVFHNEDISMFSSYLKETVEAGIDAFIVSDPSYISYMKKEFPGVEVHVSTQASTTNVESVKFLMSEGVDRIVLARELSKTQIEEIIRETGIDIEIFIHGSMCTFYSGRCVLSNYLTNRDSNRGGCSQVCRFAFDIDSGVDTKFTMATKDLNMGTYLKDLIDIGVASLKVEGRMRSLYYLATVISSYRKLIDNYYQDTLTDELIMEQERILGRVANRETSTHYFMKDADMFDQYYTGRQELSNQDYLGFVLGYDATNKQLIISERNFFTPLTEVEVFMPSGKVISFVIPSIIDEEGNILDAARHPEQVLRIPLGIEVEEKSMMRRKVVE